MSGSEQTELPRHHGAFEPVSASGTGGTPVTTLQANAHKEGAQVVAVLERHSQTVLQQHGFDAPGHPSQAAVAAVVAGRDRRLKAATVEESLTAVCQEMAARGLTPPQVAAARNRAVQAVYEDPVQCVNVAVDDVQVKQQTAHRQRRAPPTAAVIAPLETAAPAATPAGDRSPTLGASSARSRPKVAKTVARIEQGQRTALRSAAAPSGKCSGSS